MKALIFAAGRGTRLKPWTLSHPKALAVIQGITLLERTIKAIHETTGINEFIVNVHHFAEQVKAELATNRYMHRNDIKVEISDESDSLLDTGGGLLKALETFGADSLLVHNVDIITDFDYRELIAAHQRNRNHITLLISERNSSRKLLVNEEFMLRGWKNLSTGQTLPPNIEGDFSEFAFNGIYVVDGDIARQLKSYAIHLDKTAFPIVPFLVETSLTLNIQGYMSPTPYKLIDVGTPEKLQLANNIFSPYI